MPSAAAAGNRLCRARSAKNTPRASSPAASAESISLLCFLVRFRRQQQPVRALAHLARELIEIAADRCQILTDQIDAPGQRGENRTQVVNGIAHAGAVL